MNRPCPHHTRPLDFTGISLTYEWSTTLNDDWTPSGVANNGITVTIIPGASVPSDPGLETVTVTTSSNPESLQRAFVRISVSEL